MYICIHETQLLEMYWTTPFLTPKLYTTSEWDETILEPHMFTNERKIALLEKVQNIQDMQQESTLDECIVENASHSYTAPTQTQPPTQTETQTQTPTTDLYETCRKRLLFVPKCEDAIFWSLYLAKYGYREFQRIGKHNGRVEMNEKKEMTDYAFQYGSKNMSLHLRTKVTKTGLSKMIEDVLTHPRTPFSTLYLYSLYYKMNIWVVDLQKKTYLQYTHENSECVEQNVVLYKNPRGQHGTPAYFVDTEQQLYSLEHLSLYFLELVSDQKPLKSVSSYKMTDLEHIMHILGIAEMDPEGKKWKKQALYDTIAIYTGTGNQGSP